ncbi:hypothetical protein BJ165DRAFT_860215 [Panaeolus papilionaceus]|nr:hypothetical protein BJ165DRAFT_860215 [Panaeolus papilionaceus]
MTQTSWHHKFIQTFFPEGKLFLASSQFRHVPNFETRVVQAFKIVIPEADFGLVLIDTPGFNADKLEFLTLKIIADEIKDKFWRKLRFNGFIYFEPVGDLDLDTRETMLKFALEICGSENYDRVAVRNPTSFFDNDKVAPLKQPVVKDHWKPFLRRDDGELDPERVWCFDLDLESSHKETRAAIQKYLWTLVREPHVRMTSQLQLQLEQGLPLEQTSSGIAAQAYDVIHRQPKP